MTGGAARAFFKGMSSSYCHLGRQAQDAKPSVLGARPLTHCCLLQGWRLELKGFPRLSEYGAWRMRNGKPYGGYYSQEEV